MHNGIVGFKLDEEGKADPSIAGQNILIEATVCYAGTEFTTLQVGDHVVSVDNKSLEKASRTADESICG